MFAPLPELLLGLLTGLIFGFLLQKGRVAKHRVIVDQFRLRDFTVLKIMGTAVIVGGLGVLALVSLGLAEWHIKPAAWAGVVAGGALFGVGLVVLGYCPGTTVAAMGEGHRDAIAGALGMLAGAAIFVAAFPALSDFMKSAGDAGKVRIPDVVPVPAIVIFGALAAIGAVAIAIARSRRQPPERKRHVHRESLLHSSK